MKFDKERYERDEWLTDNSPIIIGLVTVIVVCWVLLVIGVLSLFI